MAESMQHKLDRVRRPRVQITYDVETNGAMEQKSLPFVTGVMADLSGHNRDPYAIADRKFVAIDQDNFNDVLASKKPKLNLRVANKLQNDGSMINAELNFKSMDDFSPANVAEQVGPLKELLDVRQRLNQLLSKMEGNDKLEELLKGILGSPEKAAALAKQLESQQPASETPKES
jgi:type VI secretion system protein ImpB